MLRPVFSQMGWHAPGLKRGASVALEVGRSCFQSDHTLSAGVTGTDRVGLAQDGTVALGVFASDDSPEEGGSGGTWDLDRDRRAPGLRHTRVARGRGRTRCGLLARAGPDSSRANGRSLRHMMARPPFGSGPAQRMVLPVQRLTAVHVRRVVDSTVVDAGPVGGHCLPRLRGLVDSNEILGLGGSVSTCD